MPLLPSSKLVPPAFSNPSPHRNQTLRAQTQSLLITLLWLLLDLRVKSKTCYTTRITKRLARRHHLHSCPAFGHCSSALLSSFPLHSCPACCHLLEHSWLPLNLALLILHPLPGLEVGSIPWPLSHGQGPCYWLSFILAKCLGSVGSRSHPLEGRGWFRRQRPWYLCTAVPT